MDKAGQDGKEENEINTILKLKAKGKTQEEISNLLDISVAIVRQVIESRSNK